MGIPDLSGMQWLAAVLMFLMFTSGSLTFLIRMMVSMQLQHDTEQRALDRQSFEMRVMGVMQQHRERTQEIVASIRPIETTTTDTNTRVKNIEDSLSKKGIVLQEIQNIAQRLASIQRFIEEKGLK